MFESLSTIFQSNQHSYYQIKLGLPFKCKLFFKFQGTKIFQYCTCPAGGTTYNFHSSCKHNVMHLSFNFTRPANTISCTCPLKVYAILNKEHKGVICNTTTSSYSSQSTRPTGRVLGKNYSSFLDFTRNYEQMSEFFVPCPAFTSFVLCFCIYLYS